LDRGYGKVPEAADQMPTVIEGMGIEPFCKPNGDGSTGEPVRLEDFRYLR
jgi:hypothetical protein